MASFAEKQIIKGKIPMNNSDKELLKEAKDIIIKAAEEAGKIMLNSFHRVEVVKFKDRQDICTNIDLEVESLLIDRIRSRFPDHNIESEEMGKKDLGSEFTWIIDPIDGSKYYWKKIRLFTTSIALRKEKEIIFGLVFFPSTGEFFYALKGQGAYLNQEKIQVSNQIRLADSFIYVELPSCELSQKIFDDYHKKLKRLLSQSCRVRSFGLGTLGLCYLARGGFEAYVNLGMDTKVYDMAAGVILVEEAGGKVTDLYGGPVDLELGRILASNGKTHNQISEIFQN